MGYVDGVASRFERSWLNMQAQSVRFLGGDAQLLLVSTARCARNSFEVVVASGRSVTTTSMLAIMLWRQVLFQMLLTLA